MENPYTIRLRRLLGRPRRVLPWGRRPANSCDGRLAGVLDENPYMASHALLDIGDAEPGLREGVACALASRAGQESVLRVLLSRALAGSPTALHALSLAGVGESLIGRAHNAFESPLHDAASHLIYTSNLGTLGTAIRALEKALDALDQAPTGGRLAGAYWRILMETLIEPESPVAVVDSLNRLLRALEESMLLAEAERLAESLLSGPGEPRSRARGLAGELLSAVERLDIEAVRLLAGRARLILSARRSATRLGLDPGAVEAYLEHVEARYGPSAAWMVAEILESAPAGRLRGLARAIEEGRPFLELASGESASILLAIAALEDAVRGGVVVEWRRRETPRSTGARLSRDHVFLADRRGVTILDMRGRLVRRYEPGFALGAWAAHPRGGVLAVSPAHGEGARAPLFIYIVSRGLEVPIGLERGAPITLMEWSTEGDLLLVARGSTVTAHRPRGGRRWSLDMGSPVSALASGHGTSAAGSWDGSIALVSRGGERRIPGRGEPIVSLAVLPGGRVLAGYWDNTIALYTPAGDLAWQAELGDQPGMLRAAPAYGLSLAGSPGGSLSLLDARGRSVYSWDPPEGALLEAGWRGEEEACALSAGGGLHLYRLTLPLAVDYCKVTGGAPGYCAPIREAARCKCPGRLEDPVLEDLAHYLCRGDLKTLSAALPMALRARPRAPWARALLALLEESGYPMLQSLSNRLSHHGLRAPLLEAYTLAIEEGRECWREKAQRIRGLLHSIAESLEQGSKARRDLLEAALQAAPPPRTLEELATLTATAATYAKAPHNTLQTHTQTRTHKRGITICNNLPFTIKTETCGRTQTLPPHQCTHHPECNTTTIIGPGGPRQLAKPTK